MESNLIESHNLTILLDNDKTAELLNISPRTLERWRLDDRGPPYIKLGSRVVYSLEKLTAWLNKQQHTPSNN